MSSTTDTQKADVQVAITQFLEVIMGDRKELDLTPEDLKAGLENLVRTVWNSQEKNEDGLGAARRLIEELAEWKPEHPLNVGPEFVKHLETHWKTSQDDWEDSPFFSEAFLYPLFGKDDARDLLGRLNDVQNALGTGWRVKSIVRDALVTPDERYQERKDRVPEKELPFENLPPMDPEELRVLSAAIAEISYQRESLRREIRNWKQEASGLREEVDSLRKRLSKCKEDLRAATKRE